IQAANWLLECLSVLQEAEDMPGMLSAFQVFSESLLLLSDLTARCLQELKASPRQKSLAQTFQLLQRCVPLLHTAKHSDLEHPYDQQISLSKEYAFQLMERTIRELISLLRGDTDSEELQDSAGIFSKRVSRLLALLSCPRSVLCSSSEFSAHVEMVVFYCMLLADLSSPDAKMDLVKHCRVLLQLSKNICSQGSQEEGPSGQNWGEGSLEEQCHAMRREVENLNRTVVTATLCQILGTFFEAEEPLRQLVEGALSLAAKGGFSAGAGGFLKMLQPLTATFFTHVQQMLRVADIVVATCTKPQTAGEIRDCVEYLKRLLGSLPPLLTEMSRNVAQVRAAEQLQSFYQAWAGATESLLLCFEETVVMHEFLQVSIQQMAKHREWCEKALESRDLQQFSSHVTILTSWAQWVVEATTRYVDRTADPIFRNGLLVWTEQLGSSIAELKTVTAVCPERLSCHQTRHVFLKTVECLIDTSRRVQEGLDGSNHPDILSPLREQVRSTEVAEELELSPSCARLQNVADETALQEDILCCPSSRAGDLHPDVVPRKADIHPVLAALLAAARARDVAAVNAACSALLEVTNCCICASKEALSVVESPVMETLGQFKNIELLTPRVISLAREAASRQFHGPCRLLQMSLKLSGRICETKECLAATAGSWYSLSQQVLHFVLSADSLSSKQALDEPLMALEGMVHLAGDIASMASSKGNDVPSVWESFLQVQVKFSHAQRNTKVLLEKAASFEGSCGVGEASLELHCVLWAVSMHVLLSAVDQFTGRDLLLLRELGSAVRHKDCLWSISAAVSENSLRLQEAARLSYLSCPEDCGSSEILELREEMRVLTEALLDASRTLSVSWLSTASLFIRFELLQRGLALRAKALLLLLEKANLEYLQVMRDVFEPALSPVSQGDRATSKQTFEGKADQLMANVEWVQSTLQDVLEAAAHLQPQASLLSIADHLHVVTSDAVASARQIFQHPQEKEYLCLEISVWDWSARAHYLVTQLQALRGISGRVSELVGWRLRSVGDQRPPRQGNSISELFPERAGAPGHTPRRREQSGAARDTCKRVQ
ncbi:CTNA1 protein, partial [Nothoprocta pentlandii]|nr:CTNA1 protein [Nothoprocta pentlandii]